MRKKVSCPRMILLTVLILVLWRPGGAPCVEAINPAQAVAAIGEERTVCGKVANTYYSCFVSGRPTFINFGKPYPDHVFSVAIMGEDRSHFGDCPEKLFTGRDVCVTGLIESYDDKPVMKVKDQSQVKWND